METRKLSKLKLSKLEGKEVRFKKYIEEEEYHGIKRVLCCSKLTLRHFRNFRHKWCIRRIHTWPYLPSWNEHHTLVCAEYFTNIQLQDNAIFFLFITIQYCLRYFNYTVHHYQESYVYVPLNNPWKTFSHTLSWLWSINVFATVISVE